jgi:uncharacterized membrane protein
MSTTPDKLVERYLKHLEVELDDVPRDRRREIVDEIAGHIAEARAGLEHETEADVRNILEGLGDPADIAEEARERLEVPARRLRSKAGAMEVAALIFLLVGGLIIPVVGWFIGVVLLWVSNVWNVRDKVIGTLFVPGGLALSFALLLMGTSLEAGRSCELDPGTGREISCVNQGGGSSGWDILRLAGLVAIVVAPLITTAYLAHRMRRYPASATA